jgi:single-strand DNA-binding protein
VLSTHTSSSKPSENRLQRRARSKFVEFGTLAIVRTSTRVHPMTMTATIYGRLAFDPRQHTTRSGTDMATARVAVDVTGRDATDEQTWWVDVLTFGAQCEQLMKLGKGDMVSAMGRCTRGTYTPAGGETRESWTLLADAIVTARSGRPGQRRRQTQDQQEHLDDELPPL